MTRPTSPQAKTVKRASKPGPTNARPGLRFPRSFTTGKQDPLNAVNWTTRTAQILDATGKVIFRQTDIEAPEFWSDMAVNVVASRYFRGVPGSKDREGSVRLMIRRVVETIAGWGREQGYFASAGDAQAFRDELTWLVLHQAASFNSPVWFNVGIDPKPQCSACFILSIQDTMESILDWYTQEGLIFKGGSGAGINLSGLRCSRERLSGGGTASGPVSFMKAADASAGVIKSGGKTRRAAKMVILDADHPDILSFIRCKAHEEQKAAALISAGFGDSFEGEAYSTVAFQNSNHSVRLTNEFMLADQDGGEWQTRFVLSRQVADSYPARELMREIALAAHACGDPGVQFDTTINHWNTCPDTGRIRASNPCSEYMQVDNSACNLASLRLTAFVDAEGNFLPEPFCQAVDVLITAQDIVVDRSSYPSPAIEANSRNMRALGLGYADLGGMIMGLGLPYDADDARAWAAAVTALLTAEAYAQSARIAQVRGPFSEFEKNRAPMLSVMRSHMAEARKLTTDGPAATLAAQAVMHWERALELGEAHGYANCQATVIAPTGTVAFMMDCDTTGIEPELALVKFKSLAGGGELKIVNRSVARALARLGYSGPATATIIDRIEHGVPPERVEELLPEHVPVFDCAFRPLGGGRLISRDGHLLMMAAVQPFISGSISKTVNLPSEATPQEIEEVFRLAWRLGLKCISVYRDGCKAVQPVAVAGEAAHKAALPVRRKLPVDCSSVRHKFEIAGQEGYIHTGFWPDGRVGEIFIRMSKEGSTISGLMDTIATLTSIALQYGVPLEALVSKFSHMRFEPSGFTRNPDIPMAKSVTDYIFRYLGVRFLSREQQQAAGLIPVEPVAGAESGGSDPSKGSASGPGQAHVHAFHSQADAPSCRECGVIMVRIGSCYKCINCGESYGCS